jgi:G:T-mismatch repair DNA endonuclease (very short patch repair protein)
MDKITENKIISEYKKGKSSLKISKIVGLSKPTILKVLNEHNLVRKRDRCSKLKYQFDGKQYSIERVCPICNQKIQTKSKDKTICCRNHLNKLKGTSLCKSCSLKLQTGEGNPFYGKKHTKKSILKMTKTLTKNPRKFSSSSKPETVIFNILKDMDYDVKKSHRVSRYICDIFVKKFNLIIEYNGDYWHCNPKKYEQDYKHPHKKKTASQIWDEDKKRIDNLIKLGYNLEVIWESDFDTQLTIKNIIKKYVK